MSIPSIETDRLLLRPFTKADGDAFYTMIGSDPDVMRYLRTGKVIPREAIDGSLTRILTHWNAHAVGLWAVEYKEDGHAFAGYCGLQMLDDTDDIELAYGFGKMYWRRGFATESAAAALRYGFEEAKLARIVAVAYSENEASQHVLLKLGMESQGIRFVYQSHLAYFVLERFNPRPGTYILQNVP
jgi:ribosomal-protein-alanine N-acetyltransferase